MPMNHLETQQANMNNGSDFSATLGHNSLDFDTRMNQLMAICQDLILRKGVFHLAIHFGNNQLVCWTFDNPYSYQIYRSDEIFADNFMRHFAPLESRLHTCIHKEQVGQILEEIKRMRKTAAKPLLNASLHMMNGYIGMGYAGEDVRFHNFKQFIPTSTIIS